MPSGRFARLRGTADGLQIAAGEAGRRLLRAQVAQSLTPVSSPPGRKAVVRGGYHIDPLAADWYEKVAPGLARTPGTDAGWRLDERAPAAR